MSYCEINNHKKHKTPPPLPPPTRSTTSTTSATTTTSSNRFSRCDSVSGYRSSSIYRNNSSTPRHRKTDGTAFDSFRTVFGDTLLKYSETVRRVRFFLGSIVYSAINNIALLEQPPAHFVIGAQFGAPESDSYSEYRTRP